METASANALAFLRDLLSKNILGEEFTKELEPQIKEAEELERNPVLKVALLGEFSSGKSTLLNALLGDKILTASERPTTATNTYLKYGEKKRALVYYADRRAPEEVAFDRLETYLADWEKGNWDVDRMEIEYPSELLKNNLVLIDTPGANDSNEKNLRTCEKAIQDANASIFLMGAQSQLNGSGLEFLNRYKEYLAKFIFVINQCDKLAVEDSEDDIDMSFSGTPETTESKLHNIVTQVQQNIESHAGISSPAIHTISAYKYLKKEPVNGFDVQGTFENLKKHILMMAEYDREKILAYKITDILQKILPRTRSANQLRLKEVDNWRKQVQADMDAIQIKRQEVIGYINQYTYEQAAAMGQYLPSMIEKDFDDLQEDAKKTIYSVTSKSEFTSDAWKKKFDKYLQGRLNQIVAHINTYCAQVSSNIVNVVREHTRTAYTSFFDQLNDYYKDLEIDRKINERNTRQAFFISGSIAACLFLICLIRGVNIAFNLLLCVIFAASAGVYQRLRLNERRKKDLALAIQGVNMYTQMNVSTKGMAAGAGNGILNTASVTSNAAFTALNLFGSVGIAAVAAGLGALFSTFFGKSLKEGQEELYNQTLQKIAECRAAMHTNMSNQIQQLQARMAQSAVQVSDQYYAAYKDTLDQISEYNRSRSQSLDQDKIALGEVHRQIEEIIPAIEQERRLLKEKLERETAR